MDRRAFGKLFTYLAGERLIASASLPPVNAGGPRFSVMLWALEKQASFEQCLEIAAAAGYQGVELVGEFHAWTPQKVRDVVARLKSLKLVVDSMSGVAAGFAVPEQGTAFLAQMAEQIRWAKELECPQIILLSGKRVDGLAAGAQRQASIDALKRASDLAAASNLELVIEPIDLLENPDIVLSSVTEAFEIARAVDRSNPGSGYLSPGSKTSSPARLCGIGAVWEADGVRQQHALRTSSACRRTVLGRSPRMPSRAASLLSSPSRRHGDSSLELLHPQSKPTICKPFGCAVFTYGAKIGLSRTSGRYECDLYRVEAVGSSPIVSATPLQPGRFQAQVAGLICGESGTQERQVLQHRS